MLSFIEYFVVDKEELWGADEFGVDFEVLHELEKVLERPVLIIFFSIFQVDFVLKIGLGYYVLTL